MFRKLSFFTVFALLAAAGMLFPSFKMSTAGGGMQLDKDQAQRAFVLLNKVRHDPNGYSERFGFSLHDVIPRPDLFWDDSLAAVAERKAMDMASRGYFGDVDPDGYGINYYINKADFALSADLIKHKHQSNLEALDRDAPSGEVAIKDIIIDKHKLGDDGRKLILGVGDFNSKLTDVGIGYVKGSGSTKYRSYICIIVAHRAKPRGEPSSF